MKYRSRSDIVGPLSDVANGGATKTKLMYKAYLSFNQLSEYLGYLFSLTDLFHLYMYDQKRVIPTSHNKIFEFLSPTSQSNTVGSMIFWQT
jgi:predicted transcriptional regulator